MDRVGAMVELVRRFLARMGPYLVLEILLPGGTLLALVLLLYRGGRLAGVAPPRPFAPATPAIVRVCAMATAAWA
jgi:hypothetical protein